MMFGWPVVTVILFALMPARRAVLWSLVLGWMFLPEAKYSFPGIPDFTKGYSIALSALFAVMVFDTGRLLQFRPSWMDLPMLGFLCVPFVSSITNNLGAYDGLSSMNGQVMTWGVPYFLGRVYYTNQTLLLRELALVIVVAALIYTPLCLWEMRMSPHLHKTVYGQHAHIFNQTKRFGGFRPTVFMQHGLMVGYFMCSAALIATWLWQGKTLRGLWGMPMWTVAVGLLGVAVLCKSVGAILLLIGGLGIVAITRLRPTRWVLLALLAVPPLYMTLRANGTLDAELAVRPAEIIVPFQSGSLGWRLMHEDALIEHALTRPGFGWAGHGRAHLTNRRGARISTTDGLWIIMLGKHGLIGMGLFILVLLVPPLMAVWRLPPTTWLTPAGAPVVALITVYGLWGVDNLFNAMISPMYVLAGGGLVSASIHLAQAARAARRQNTQAAQARQVAMRRGAGRTRSAAAPARYPSAAQRSHADS